MGSQILHWIIDHPNALRGWIELALWAGGGLLGAWHWRQQRRRRAVGELEMIYHYDILSAMHVIMKPALVEFWTKYPEAKGPLEAWYRIMRRQVFADFNALRRTFGSADHVDPFTVFNVGGKKYRLIVVIHYDRRKIFIQGVLTHGEYNRDRWKRKD